MAKCKKITYDSLKKAKRIAEWLFEKRKRNLRPYKCHICKKYHLYTVFKDSEYYDKRDVDTENDHLARYEIDTTNIGKEIEAEEQRKQGLLDRFKRKK
jgi:hypothetical protein